MSNSIGAMQVGAQTPSLAQLVAARDSAPASHTSPVPTDTVQLSPEAKSTIGEGARAVAQSGPEPVPARTVSPAEQPQPAPKSVHVVA